MLDDEIKQYFHSVCLDEERCKGCVNCIKRCPTEAIRVRDGKAHIVEVRCIDCGECVRTCTNQAKVVVADTMERLKEFKYNVALPAPAIYGQFREGTKPGQVLGTMLALGFDDVFDVAFAADLVGKKIRETMHASPDVRPYISSACPTVVRLIQVRFPNLVEHLMPIVSPMRVAASIVRDRVSKKTGLYNNEIGVWFISPCPGKVSAIHETEVSEEKSLNGAIPIAELYPLLREKLIRDPEIIDEIIRKLPRGSGLGLGWARSGGENQSIANDRQIAVDGIHNVIQILEEVERGKLADIDYIEAQSCVGGCVGGVLTVENPFITRRRIRIMATEYADELARVEDDPIAQDALTHDEWFMHDRPVAPRPTLKLDEDMASAIRKMEQMERIMADLPGLDCGSCGAPNCRALAEDVVRGLATEMDCVFKLRERVRELAGEMILLAEKAPPALGENWKRTEKNGAPQSNSTKPEPKSEK